MEEGYVWADTENVTYVSCYISPNCSMQDYERILDKVRAVVVAAKNEVIIGEDFNAKSFLWESTVNDKRGEILGDIIGELDLVVINQGDTPTYRRRNRCSVIDVTLATQGIAAKIMSWRVDEEAENLSDHNSIFFDVTDVNMTCQVPTTRRWKVTEDGITQLKMLADKWKTRDTLTKDIQDMCEKTLRRKRVRKGKAPVHWWSNAVSEARKTTLAARRRLQRTNKRLGATVGEKEAAEAAYKTLRKQFRFAIAKAKKRSWDTLLQEIDGDVWGLGYKIATNKIRRAIPTVSPRETKKQVALLFPIRPKTLWQKIKRDDAENFTENEVKQAAYLAKNNKAPGPDNIPAEAIKAIAEVNATPITTEINKLWSTGTFPTTWKVARLILIEKPDSEAANRKFRPICLLNSMSKLYERLIKTRLEKALETTENLHEHQYGFRAGRSTIDAIQHVLKIVDQVNRVSYVCRRYSVLVTLDIKNAFNSLRWDVIISELQRRKLPASLIMVIQDYLNRRTIETTSGTRHQITCGVPQGSVLGPTLWNVAYDKVLKTTVPAETTLIAFADDLAVVVCARDIDILRGRAETAVKNITAVLKDMGLDLAGHKTEMVILAGRMKLRELNVNFGSHNIVAKTAIRYLGVHIDKDAKMTQHAIEVAKKAEKQVAALSRLMPNLRGPRQLTRRLYAGVIASTILYAAPAWRKVWKTKKYAGMLERVNRRVALRITMAYRTVSLEASLVLAGIPPLELLAEERCKVHEGSDKLTARKTLMTDWQRRWEASGDGAWTKRLIPKLETWVDRMVEDTELNHHMTQIMTGHGIFNKYRQRIRKTDNPGCWYCDAPSDDAEHTCFVCPRWADDRAQTASSVGILTPDNIVRVMLQNKQNWTAISGFMTRVMTQKANDERDLEKTI